MPCENQAAQSGGPNSETQPVKSCPAICGDGITKNENRLEMGVKGPHYQLIKELREDKDGEQAPVEKEVGPLAEIHPPGGVHALEFLLESYPDPSGQHGMQSREPGVSRWFSKTTANPEVRHGERELPRM